MYSEMLRMLSSDSGYYVRYFPPLTTHAHTLRLVLRYKPIIQSSNRPIYNRCDPTSKLESKYYSTSTIIDGLIAYLSFPGPITDLPRLWLESIGIDSLA